MNCEKKEENSLFNISPTIFFTSDNGILKQRIELEVFNTTPGAEARLEVKTAKGLQSFNLGSLRGGKQKIDVDIEEIREETDALFKLYIGGKSSEVREILNPEKKWQLCLVPSVHTDLGYTDLFPKTFALHAKNIDHIIDICNETKGLSENKRLKWNIEASWAFLNYEMRRPKKRVNELVSLVKEGLIDVSAWYSQQLTAFCSHEEICRMFYLAERLRKEYGIEIKSAISTDLPSFTYIMPTIMKKSGVDYFAVGINNCRGNFHKNTNLITPFYWVGPDNSEVLTWFTDGYRQGQILGLADHYTHKASVEVVYKNLPEFMKQYKNCPFDIAMLYGLLDDNWSTKEAYKTVEVINEWNSKFSYPSIKMFTNTEFFKLIESQYGNKLIRSKGDWGSYWEDGVGSTARETAMIRKALNEFPAAESLRSFFDMANGKPDAGQAEDMKYVLDGLLFLTDGSWCGLKSIIAPQEKMQKEIWKFKQDTIRATSKKISGMVDNGLLNLASLVKCEDESIIVFNQLSWEREGVVNAKVKHDGSFKVVDSQGNEVNYQIVGKSKDETLIQLYAKEVPSMGYKVLNIKEGQPAETKENGGLENKFYKIELGDEGIKSIIDKETGQELVDSSKGFKLGQLIYDEGEERSTLPEPLGEYFMMLLDRKPKSHTRNKAGGYKASKVTSGNISKAVTLEAKMKRFPKIFQEIILYNDIKRIDFVNTVVKTLTYDKEGAYYSFPFDFSHPEVKIDLPSAIIKPGEEQIRGACKDWYAIQNWVKMQGKGKGLVWATLEAPMVEFGGINNGLWQGWIDIENGLIMSYIMNNYWFTNYKAGQGGRATFSYSITSGNKFSNTEASKFGMGFSNPMIALWSPKKEGNLSSDKRSFCSLDRDNVRVSAFKKAEDGKGYIVRMVEMEGNSSLTKVKIPGVSIKEAYLTDMVENNKEGLDFGNDYLKVLVDSFSIATARIVLG